MPLDSYASPLIRMAVFRRLNPGVQITFEILPIEDAMPAYFANGPSGCPQSPVEVVRCTAILTDGSWIEADREVDLCEQGRDKKWRDIDLTPEYYAKVQTKAMGRMLTRAGIPQKDYELRDLMRWIVALDGRPLSTVGSAPAGVDTSTGEIVDRSAFAAMPSAEEVDDPDADDDTLTPNQELAQRFQELPGTIKAKVAKWARESLGIANVMAAPADQIDAVHEYIDKEEHEFENAER